MKTFLYNLLIALVAILAPLKTSVIAMGFLIMSDLLMGLIASKRLKIPITSKKLKNTGVKMLVYNLLILCGYITELYLVTFIPFTQLCLIFLAVVEVKSIAENFQRITGLPFVKYITKWINYKLNQDDNK